MPDEPQSLLTATEIVVADLAVRGKRDHEIADELGVPPSTVQRHLAHVYGKLGVRSRAELVTRVAKGAPGE